VARSLSGGNLQKFILGREILHEPQLLVAAHPTWGVDVGAAGAIHRALLELRDRGAALLVISEDLDELLTLADRIGVLYQGRLSPVRQTSSTTVEEIGLWMGGRFEAETVTPTLNADGTVDYAP
jgi:simple sugar transport system ATP-binding protein